MSVRTLRRVVLWLLAGIVILVLLFLAAVHTPPSRRFLLGLIQNSVADLRIEGLSYNLAAGTATLMGIELGADEMPFLTADRIDLDVSLRSLVLGDIVVQGATVTNLDIHLIVNEDGTTNIPEFGADDGTPPPDRLPEFLIERLAANGSFTFTSPDANAQLPAWTLAINGTPGFVHNVDFGIPQAGSAQYQLQGETRMTTISALDLDGQFTRDSVTLQQLLLDVTGAQLMASGTMQGFADPELDMRVSADADLQPVLAMDNISGNVMANVFATGTVSELQVSADVASQNLRVDRLNQIDLTAQANWSRQDEIVRIESARVATPEGVVTANAAIGPEESQAAAQIQRLDLARVSRLAELPVQIASTLTGSVNARWQGTNFEAADANANLRLTPADIEPSREIIPLSGSLEARVRNQQVNLTARDIAAFGAVANAEIATHIERRNLSGTLHAEVPDAALTLDALDVAMETPATGRAELDATLDGTLDRPTAMATLTGSNINYGQIQNLNLTAQANYTPELVEVPEAQIMWQGTQIMAQGSVGLESETQPIQFTASSTNVNIPDVLSAFNQDLPVSGTVAFNAQGTGTIDAPVITATLTGQDLVAYEEPLGQLMAQVNYTAPQVDVPQLQLTRPNDLGTLSGTASYNLDARTYTVDLEGQNLAINQPQVSAVVNAMITGSGSVDNPMADVEITATDVQTQDRMLGEVALTGTVANQMANVMLTAPAFNVRAEAQASTNAPYNTTAQVFLDNTDLATLPWGQAEPPVRGNITAQIEASGIPEQWRQGEVTATIPNLAVETEIGQVTNTEPIQLAYRNETVEVTSARLAGPGSTLSLSGMLPGTLSYEGDVDLSALPLGEEQQAAGRVQLMGALMGTLEMVTPTATITVMDGRYQSPQVPSPVENVQLQANLENGLLTVDNVGARVGTGIVSGAGAIPLSLFPLPEMIDVPAMTMPAQFDLALTGLSFDSVADLPENVNGTVSLTVHAETTRPEINAITAEATIQQLIVGASGVRVQTTNEPPVISLNNGMVNIDRFELTGPGTDVMLSGGVSLMDRTLQDVALNGTVNAGLLNSFTQDVTAAGDVMLMIAANGTLTEPSIDGTITMDDGRFGLDDPRVDATNLDVNIALAGQQITIQQFTGDLNGGTLSASGTVDLAGQVTPNLQVAIKDVFLDVPEGLQTRSSADLTLAPRPNDNLLLSGTATVHEGGYSEPLDLQRALEEYFGPGTGTGTVELVEERNPLLSRLEFDIEIDSEDPILFDNNLGKLAISLNARLVGSYYRPGLTGFVDIAEGGTLHLQEHDYAIERGRVNFINETEIQPELDIVATTRVRDRNITVNITTDAAGKTALELASDNPDDTRADITALLLTGRTAEELEGGQAGQATELAALSLLAGQVTGRLSQQVESGLGTTAIRVEPNLISQESDPTARLTVGQDLTQFLQFIYSMNLRDSSDQIWILSYNVRPNINLRATQQADNSFRYDFQHDLRFGLDRPSAGRRVTPNPRQIGTIEFTGNLQFPESELQKRLDIKTGDEYNFFEIRDGLDHIERFYRDRGFLESQVRLRRMEEGQTVNLQVEVNAGPTVEFVFEGWDAPRGLRNSVRDEWQRGVFDTQRTDASLEQIRRRLARDGYLNPMLEAEVRMPAEGNKNVLFTIDRGRRYQGVELVFDGAQGLDPEVLREQLKEADLLHEPRQARDFLQSFYRQNGFLDVQVETPEYEYDEDTGAARLVTQIEEGPRFRWGEVNITGADAFADSEIRQFAGFDPGTYYAPRVAENSRAQVQDAYWRRGYRDVEIEYALTRNSEEGLVNVNITIMEGQQSIVREVAVEGTQITSPSFVRNQIELMPGDVLDFSKTIDSRRNLYNTGAFSAVDLRSDPITAVEDPTLPYKDVRLLATVQEPNPFRLRYGAYFDTDRGPGAIVDLRNQNSLGSGRVVGFRGRYDYDIHEARGYFSQPLLRNLPLRTDASVFVNRQFQRTDLTDGTESVIITDRTGFTIQEGLQLAQRFFFTFGYSLERAHTYEQDPDPFLPFDETIYTAPLTMTLTRETRDDILDATHGSFTSHAFEVSLDQLGADLTFWRYFGQYFRYFPLTDPAPVPFRGGVEKPRFIFATGARVGLAKPFAGQTFLVRSQRFFTGGGTTLRGFDQDTVGPVDILGLPQGGEAMFLLNNELRFPVASIFDGVGFLDLGNVYQTLGDFDILDLRKTAGAGIRVRTPYILLRLDYGFKLDRQPGESRGKWFFSIGQAF